MSKGSTPRRCQVSREEYERRWGRAFGGGDYLASGRAVRDFVETYRRQEAELVTRVGTPAENFARRWAEPDATGHP